MRWRTPVLLLSTLAVSAAAGCDDVSDSLRNERPGSGDEDPALAALREALTAGPAMTRNLSNREYLNVVSDLIGERLPLDLQKAWTATTQFSGFDAVPWTNLDTKAVRDLSETLEAVLDRAVVSPKVMTCSVDEAARLPYDACAKSIVEPFALRAYGRPLAPAEAEALAKRYAEGVALAQSALTEPNAVFLDGLRAALGAVLLAPQLVTRIEAPPTPDFTGERELDAYELASRLSFMFTASIPDDELWRRAVDGTLVSQPDALVAEVERLIDTRTDVFVQSFMGQWFDFRAYDSTAPGTLEHAMWNESWRVMADVLKEDLPVTAIVQPGFTYLNQELATHYNVVGEFSRELTRVAIDERGGVLQQGSWLSLSASSLKTSPIHRGRLVQDRLLCKVIPPPDSALFEQIQKVSESIPANASVKERLESHRNAGPACAGCHEYMDPLGLGLEGFDMRGRLRDAYADTGRPVETASTLLGKPFSRFGELNTMIAELPDYHRCAAEKLTVYSTRRVVHAASKADADLLAYLTYSADGRPPSLRAMIRRLVTSKAFRSVSHGGAG
ncbi:MAG: DUF1588 domain-containing protein [Labilithrix sp.]|nr:DUF1588 domain-containing protein [Labilithrix sp.]